MACERVEARTPSDVPKLGPVGANQGEQLAIGAVLQTRRVRVYRKAPVPFPLTQVPELDAPIYAFGHADGQGCPIRRESDSSKRALSLQRQSADLFASRYLQQ